MPTIAEIVAALEQALTDAETRFQQVNENEHGAEKAFGFARVLGGLRGSVRGAILDLEHVDRVAALKGGN